MVHRHKHLCFTSQLWLPYLAFCFDLTECFQGLHIWSRIMGSKSGKLQYMLQIVTHTYTMCHDWFPQIRKGTRDKSDLAQPPGQALSHWVSNSDGGWFMGVS